VTLRGPILAREEKTVLRAVAAVRAVLTVENQLEVHHQPGDIPELQGGRERRASQFACWQTNWSPPATFQEPARLKATIREVATSRRRRMCEKPFVEPVGQTIQLFNGVNLGGWRQAGLGRFRADNGMPFPLLTMTTLAITSPYGMVQFGLR
jgi:hypothetical protein